MMDLEQREDLQQLYKDQQDWIADVLVELYDKVSQHRAEAQRLNREHSNPTTPQGKVARALAMQHEQVAKENYLTTQATLKNETEEMVEISNYLHGNLEKAIRMIWHPSPFILAILILFLIISSFVFNKSNSIPKVAAPKIMSLEIPRQASEIIVTPQVRPTQQPIKSIFIHESKEVAGILEQIRKAQLKKDINLFLNAYSPSFPNIDKKKESILRTWHQHDYLDMHFHVENIQKVNAHTIIARVVWEFTFVNVRSKKKSNLLKSYTIRFSDVSGTWLIQDVIRREKI
jgi:hypothetical protein